MGKRTQYSSYCRECGRGTNKMTMFCLGPDCTGRLVSRGLALETLAITPEELDARNAPKPDTCPDCGHQAHPNYDSMCMTRNCPICHNVQCFKHSLQPPENT